MAAALKSNLIRSRTRSRSWVEALVQSLSAQDFLVGTYLSLLLLIVLGGTGPNPLEGERAVELQIALFVAGLCVTRGGLLRGLAGAMAYRVLGPVIMFMSYFQLRIVLPAVSSAAYDLDIFAFDIRVFGVEPSLAWDRFVTPAATEWFSFFYLGYFVLLATYLSAMVLLCRDQRRLASFGLGVFMLFSAGQLLYTVVPGFGPYASLAERFTNPLAGPFFWPLVERTVNAAGALKDIFPSLHTAVPTYFALFTFRHRKSGAAYRLLWPIVTLIASQIVTATMYLRWHYLIDVVAGLMLAAFVDVVSHRVGRWEVARRERLGLPPVFEAL